MSTEMPKGHSEELRDWLATQPHLPPISDQMLRVFHHSCFFELAKTKDCIDTYYSLRANLPEIFCNRDVNKKEIETSIGNITNVIIPKKTPEGYQVLFQKIQSTDYSIYNFDEACKLFIMSMDSVIREEGPLPGYMILLDYKNVRLGHLAKTNMSTLKKMFKYIQEAAPVRLKSIHMINMNYFIEKVMSFVKPFMNKELYNLIHFYPEGELEKVHKFIPPECLPADYGGSLETTHYLKDQYISKMKDLTDIMLKEELASTVKENLRPKKQKKKKDDKKDAGISLKSLEID
ncbi:retinaldehyde-binding protein 1 [Nilaparvata lugens]|uniref:retinaldehyde-binding protein 1 n=1 Tax=Nilaparvata lugens TaxID=108931 RepID=UPI000B9867D4|nr:retinaldehyde-binding protein 1 [Nilaparvata lugens]XP_022186342.1 retinaldehyde-binding protein 1 [Nilaparvata lugens]